MRKMFASLATCCLVASLCGPAWAGGLCDDTLTGSFKQTCRMTSYADYCIARCEYTKQSGSSSRPVYHTAYRTNHVYRDNEQCVVTTEKETYTLPDCGTPLENADGYLSPIKAGLF